MDGEGAQQGLEKGLRVKEQVGQEQDRGTASMRQKQSGKEQRNKNNLETQRYRETMMNRHARITQGNDEQL